MRKRIKSYKRFISIFLAVIMIYSMGFSGVKVYAANPLTMTLAVYDQSIAAKATINVQVNGNTSIKVTNPDGTNATGDWYVGSSYIVSANGTYQFTATDSTGASTSKSITVSNVTNATNVTNGDWSTQSLILKDTSEAQLMVRTGDIDNFGFGWPSGFNPFSGNNTPKHDYGYSLQPHNDAEGTDRTMVTSGYNGYVTNSVNVGSGRSSKNINVSTYNTTSSEDLTDGYTKQTRRDGDKYIEVSSDVSSYYKYSYNGSYVYSKEHIPQVSNNVSPITISYADQLNNINVLNATIQLFVDDFQAGTTQEGSPAGTFHISNVKYKATINGTEIPELSNLINQLNQSGPIGKLITFQLPERYLDLVRTGSIAIKIDDTTTTKYSDGYAIDFAKLLINKKGFANTGTITGRVTDKATGNPISGAKVSAGGVVEANTIGDGTYKLEHVPAGLVVITASKSGYNSESYTKSIVEGGGYIQDFSLTPSTPPRAPTITATPTTIINNNVIANINYLDDPLIKQYRINIGGVTGEWKVYTGSFNVTQNCTIEAQGINQYENESQITSYVVSNIDKEGPSLILRQNYDGIITATATDNVAVASITKPDNTVVYGGSTTYPISGDGTYTFKATDTAGNVTTKSIVISNLPVINAKFDSYTPNPAKSTDEITLKYNINADPFTLPNQAIDEAVVLEDMSKDMLDNSRWSMYQDGLPNQLLTYIGNSNIRFGVVGYNDSVYVGSRENEFNEPKTQNLKITDGNLSNIDTTKFFPFFGLDNGNVKDGYKQFYQNGYIRNNISNNDTREFGTALKVADKLLTQYGTADAKKAIIIISSGSLSYTDVEIENIKNKGYKIITMDISNSSSTNIEDTHKKLSSGNPKGSIYHIGTFNDQSNYNSTDSDMKEIALELKGEISADTLSIKDAKLNIDLGESFEAGNNSSGLEGSGRIRTVTIPEINFTKNADGSWVQAEPIEVTFKVKPVSGKYGDLAFGNNSTISYTNYNGVLINKPIDTPKITINNIVENLDTTPPTLTLTQSTDDPKKIVAKASDSGSGVASITKPDTSIENFATYPPEASIDYTVSTSGTYEFTATDKAGNKTTKSIPINITASTAVKMEVSDSSGTINKKYDSTINDPDYTVDNNGEPYKLYGQSNVAIDVQDKNATHLKYRFVKDGQIPSEDDWQYMVLGGDVDTTRPGYLTQMPYDVSHMPLMTNNAMWSNRNEVYKTPFTDKTGPISTNITNANTSYVTSENVRDKDGNPITRWVPKTLFVNDQWVEGYAPGYKEARKTWGYIKVDQTGDYYLKAFSDDGFYGTISVNGELKVLGDDFRPRGINDAGLNTTGAIRLEAGKYYPIYLEYFNWGGRAAFEIQASFNDQNNYKLIGSANSHFTLYPSNSDSPIESENNIFMGSNTINFKTEPGVYKIQYALLKEKDTSTAEQKEYDEISRGSFGKFEVEERFDGLSEGFSKDRVLQGEEFNINYTVKPKPIKLIDLYKGEDSSNKPNSLYVKNLILTDKLPQGLERSDGTDSNDKSIISRVTDIEYKYNAQTNEYEADEYVFSVNVKLISQSLDNITFTQSGQIDYRDVSLKDDSRISQTQHFNNIPMFGRNSLIVKHGLYNGNGANITEEKDIKDVTGNPITTGISVTTGIPATLAMVIQANSSNPVINLSTDKSKIPQGTIEFKMYKISDADSETIDTTISPKVLELNNTGDINLIGFTMESGHKYLIVYTLAPSGSGVTTITATADGTTSKLVNLNITPQPDLF